jgi:hypothetical protein
MDRNGFCFVQVNANDVDDHALRAEMISLGCQSVGLPEAKTALFRLYEHRVF